MVFLKGQTASYIASSIALNVLGRLTQHWMFLQTSNNMLGTNSEGEKLLWTFLKFSHLVEDEADFIIPH